MSCTGGRRSWLNSFAASRDGSPSPPVRGSFFLVAIIGIALWAITGPIFGFSDTWQLVINTSTTILTFLLGVLILLEANRQAKESKVVHDELLHHVKGARDSLINIDEMSERGSRQARGGPTRQGRPGRRAGRARAAPAAPAAGPSRTRRRAERNRPSPSTRLPPA
jgi:low affinity Fe/Cu permease